MRATALPIPASEGWFLRRYLKLKLTLFLKRMIFEWLIFLLIIVSPI